MPKVYIESLHLPKGFPINEYANLAAIQADGGTDERITSVVNNYIHQKDGLVQGRDDLVTYVEGVIKFPRSYKKVTVGTGTDAKVKNVPADEHKTEAKYLEAFVTAVVEKKFTVTGVTLTGTNDEQNEAIMWTFLQTIVDKVYEGDSTILGKTEKVRLFDLKNDIKAPERASKAKSLPEYALAGAASILAGPNVKKWVTTFASKGIVHDPFDIPVKGTPDEQAATKKANVEALARAIVLNEAADRAKKYA